MFTNNDANTQQKIEPNTRTKKPQTILFKALESTSPEFTVRWANKRSFTFANSGWVFVELA